MATSVQKTVTTTAGIIVAASPFDQTVALHSGSGTVYLGDSTVTTSTGYRMDNGDKVVLPVGDHEPLYAITSSGTAILYIYINTN
jgi:hypothetical protein